MATKIRLIPTLEGKTAKDFVEKADRNLAKVRAWNKIPEKCFVCQNALTDICHECINYPLKKA
jgi:hypothetical protein